MSQKVKIPLDTIEDYFCTEDGRIFRGETELKGWRHRHWHPQKGYDYDKEYLRFAIYVNVAKPDKPKKFKRKQFYAQRIVGMCFHNLLDDPSRIMRHLTNDTMNNHYTVVVPGTQYDNMTIDRIEQGTYMNRGGG